VIILKTFGLCLALATLAVVLVLPPWLMVDNLTGTQPILARRSLESIPLMPSYIVYNMIESAVSLAVGPSLDPELLETEAYWQTLEDRI
jgi:hypothetical protein